MGRTLVLLFVIPAISMALIALYQLVDEMSKKKFILERRGTGTGDQAAAIAARRRYVDSLEAGTLRDGEAGTSETKTDVPVGQVHGV